MAGAVESKLAMRIETRKIIWLPPAWHGHLTHWSQEESKKFILGLTAAAPMCFFGHSNTR